MPAATKDFSNPDHTEPQAHRVGSNSEFLWYIPNQVTSGHRGDSIVENHNSLETLTSQAKALEDYGWKGALIGTGWGRPDTFTVAAALAARTTTFEPLIAIRPGYWRPANFASAVGHAGPTDRRPCADQRRIGQGQPRRVRRQRGRPGAPLCPHQGVHAAGSQTMDRRERYLYGRAFPGHRIHRVAAHPSPRRAVDIPSSISAAPRRRPNGSPPRRRMSSSSGVSHSMASGSGSSG